ncbi:MAG: N-acetylgalactosamine-6-sulfatase, partial [Verrucomicrobia bacterium]
MKSIHRKTGILGVALLALGAVAACGADQGKPNVLFIMADDLGWRDLGCMGSRFYQTPHVDRLATQGMLFTDAYAANPLCSPTRASVLTGLWPSRIGITSATCHEPNATFKASIGTTAPPNKRTVEPLSATRLNTDYFTIAESFKKAGYKTAHIGKWHLGPPPFSPLEQGFDVDIPHSNAPSPLGSGYINPWPVWPGEGNPGDHLEDRMAEEAVRFIKENKDRPFFMNYWAFSPHSPYQTKPELVGKYAGLADSEDPQHNPVYAGMIEVFDDAVGRLLATLDEVGIAENTIVVFYSDNGPWTKGAYAHVHPPAYNGVPQTSALPLRGCKATLNEAGVRVPLIVSWPGHIEPGSRNSDIVSSVDFYPTLLELCGLSPAKGQAFDGMSIVPSLKGEKLDRDEYFCHFPHTIPATGAIPA